MAIINRAEDLVPSGIYMGMTGDVWRQIKGRWTGHTGGAYDDPALFVDREGPLTPLVPESSGAKRPSIIIAVADALAATASDEDGWLSDAQMADPQVDGNSFVSFCGEGTIDLHHIAEIAEREAARS